MFREDSHYFFKDHWLGLMRGEIDDCWCTEADYQCNECRQSYVWTDGRPMDFDGWSTASNDTEPLYKDCARLTHTGWAAEDCETYLQHICERGLN